ncbi:unnamed protein product [Soboliphyme baturini]|uniref:Transcription initiation factor TFIID subunit 2 n=1 Tax=Soboliphyme baturini TaxID=241478 RepID=A0A183JAB1_9BILA|nr:unnamed protein product [Soboliphyme baturini]
MSRFPFIGFETKFIRDYLKNCLKLANYFVDLRFAILNLIVERLLMIDTSCAKETAHGQQALEQNAAEIFEMDCVDVGMSHENPLNKLDECMLWMFDFVHGQCHNDDGSFCLSSAYPFVKVMTDVFQESVLPIQGCFTVPFLWFYLCSFREMISNYFMKWLWRTVRSPSVPPNLRLNASCYLASILARAKYVSIETVLLHVREWTDWLHQFIDTDDSGSNSSAAYCYTFYAICQSLLYVIAFRIREIISLPTGGLIQRKFL